MPPDTTSLRSGTKHILIVEDDAFLANAYRIKVEKAGYRVSMAADGEEALRLFQESPADLILLDLVMPHMDGFTVLEKIRSMPKGKKTPIMVISNLEQDEDLERAKRAGANDYIVKSDIRLKDMLKKVSALLQS